jgi:hypothetical protein
MAALMIRVISTQLYPARRREKPDGLGGSEGLSPTAQKRFPRKKNPLIGRTP